MKLRNKTTGEVATLTLSSNGEDLLLMKNDEMVTRGVKLSDLEEWEDYEEPKEVWFISNNGQIHAEDGHDRYREERQSIGNYFETRKEAEKAVEKLKAWKRLKDKGFRFNGWDGTQIGSNISYISEVYYEGCADDMDLLFGGEE